MIPALTIPPREMIVSREDIHNYTYDYNVFKDSENQLREYRNSMPKS